MDGRMKLVRKRSRDMELGLCLDVDLYKHLPDHQTRNER
jgi:hypothetical protein